MTKNSILTGDNPFYKGNPEINENEELEEGGYMGNPGQKASDLSYRRLSKAKELAKKDGKDFSRLPYGHQQDYHNKAAEHVKEEAEQVDEDIRNTFKKAKTAVTNARRKYVGLTNKEKQAAQRARDERDYRLHKSISDLEATHKGAFPKKPSSSTMKKEEFELDEAEIQEAFDLVDQYESLLEQLIEIEEQLEAREIDLDQYFSEEEVEEGFEGSSKMQKLIAQRKAALRRKLRQGYKYKK